LDNEWAADRVLDVLERKKRLLAHNPNIGCGWIDLSAVVVIVAG
jgi:hypothetical protein